MSETPTPRTDAAMCGFCLIRHARQLERELAAMKAESDLAHKRAGDRWKMYYTEVQDHVITKRELAAANEALNIRTIELKEALVAVDSANLACERKEEARKEAVALAERLRDAMNELDADVQAERGVDAEGKG